MYLKDTKIKILHSTIKCPICVFEKPEETPIDIYIGFYRYTKCNSLLKGHSV